jgi:hypothetical protein
MAQIGRNLQIHEKKTIGAWGAFFRDCHPGSAMDGQEL